MSAHVTFDTSSFLTSKHSVFYTQQGNFSKHSTDQRDYHCSQTSVIFLFPTSLRHVWYPVKASRDSLRKSPCNVTAVQSQPETTGTRPFVYLQYACPERPIPQEVATLVGHRLLGTIRVT